MGYDFKISIIKELRVYIGIVTDPECIVHAGTEDHFIGDFMGKEARTTPTQDIIKRWNMHP